MKEKNKLISIRIIGIIGTTLLITFMVSSIIYWAEGPFQEVSGDVGGISFYTGLLLILIFRVNFYLTDTIGMIFDPRGFIKEWRKARTRGGK